MFLTTLNFTEVSNEFFFPLHGFQQEKALDFILRESVFSDIEKP